MAKFTKKWLKDFEKRFKASFKAINDLEKEYYEMVDSNPDQWELNRFYTMEMLSFENSNDLSIFHQEKTDETDEYVEIGIDGSSLSGFSFKVKSLSDLIKFRNDLIEAIDKFQRPIEEEKIEYDTDDCDDYEEDDEYHEYTIKAEQPLTQSWTYTVTARSACEAIKMVEEDNYQDGVVNNDDNEYYDYGEIEYESI